MNAPKRAEKRMFKKYCIWTLAARYRNDTGRKSTTRRIQRGVDDLLAAKIAPAFEELVHEAQTDFAENLPIAANAEGGGNEQPARDEALAQEDLLVHDSKRVRSLNTFVPSA